MDVFSCVRHEMPYRHVYHRVTTYKSLFLLSITFG